MADQDKTILYEGGPGDGGMAPLGALISEKWELVEHIGEGGMSDVFKARHVLMNKFGAVKFLKGNLAEDPNAVRRFQQEALASGTLSHPNIVQVLDCGLSPYGAYLIMELLEGVSLTEVLEARAADAPNKRGMLKISEALPIFIQICDGLEHAHKKGIVHRDIKPSNVMLVEPEAPKTDDPEEVQVKLVDFGIAKMAGRDGTSPDGSLTRTGEVFGSPLYMSPEQCLGRKLDGRADIYSLGCLMYECLTGSKLLAGNNATETMMRHVEEDADLTTIIEMKVPQAKSLAIILEGCLRRRAHERYEDIVAVREALMAVDRTVSGGGRSQAIRAGHGGYSAPVEPVEHVFKPLVFVLIGVCLLLLAGGSIFVYSIWPVQSTATIAAKPVLMPQKPVTPPKKNLHVMSPRIFDGGEGIVAKLKVSPERKRHNCIEVLKKADQALALKHYPDAHRFYAFVLNIVRESDTQVPGGPDLVLDALIGQTLSQDPNAELDQLDIALGGVIKGDPAYYNASNRHKRYALQKRAEVQVANGNYSAASQTINEMMQRYADDEKSVKEAEANPFLGPASNEDVETVNEMELQKSIWLGMLADLLRLTQEKDTHSPIVLADYAAALAGLEHADISDPKYANEVKIYKGRLYYRYGLALSQVQKYAEAYKAFASSLLVFKEQGGLLTPEMQADRIQMYLALKNTDPIESLKYRLENHL